MANAVKSFIKEPLWPSTSSIYTFIIAPNLIFTLALTIWIPLPISHPLIDINRSILLIFIFIISSLAIYSIFWSRWASDSKYTNWNIIGSSTISCEVTLAIILLSVLQINGSFILLTVIITKKHLWLTLTQNLITSILVE